MHTYGNAAGEAQDDGSFVRTTQQIKSCMNPASPVKIRYKPLGLSEEIYYRGGKDAISMELIQFPDLYWSLQHTSHNCQQVPETGHDLSLLFAVYL